MKFQIADRSGHSILDFDKNAEGQSEAFAKFNALIAEGKTAYARRGDTVRPVKVLDPDADTHLFMTPLQGG